MKYQHPYIVYKPVPQVECKFRELSEKQIEEECNKAIDNMLKNIRIRNKKFFE